MAVESEQVHTPFESPPRRIETWETRIIDILRTVDTITSAELAAITGLKHARAASLLSRNALYGRIALVRRHKGAATAQNRIPALYAAIKRRDPA